MRAVTSFRDRRSVRRGVLDFRAVLASPWAQPIRPLLHLLAFYPLLLVVVAVVFGLVWGGLMSEYDAAHILWSYHGLTGFLSGVAVAGVLAGVIVATCLLDRRRHARATTLSTGAAGPLPLPPGWACATAWCLLLAAAAAPAVVCPDWFRLHAVNGEVWEAAEGEGGGDVAGARQAMRGARWWFPTGLLVAGLAGVAAWRLAKRWKMDPARIALAAVIVLGGGYLVMFLLHASVTDLYCPAFPAPIAVLLLLGFVVGLLWLILDRAGRGAWWLYPLLVVVPTVLFLVPQLQMEYRLPHMGYAGLTGQTYYDECERADLPADLADYDRYKLDQPGSGAIQLSTDLRDYDRATDPRRKEADGGSVPSRYRRELSGSEVGLADDRKALQAWHNRMKAVYGAPQPLVIVTVSGGASASAVYCADVLFTLEEQFPGFGDRVRLIAGASGGMLGAAYFVTQLRPGGVIDQVRRSPEYRRFHTAQRAVAGVASPSPAARAELETATSEYRAYVQQRRADFFRGLEQDYLSPLVQKWVHKDVPLSIVPTHTTNDRGSALEAAWSRSLPQNPVAPTANGANGGALDIPMRSLRDEEAEGLLPSLVFTPMMVEDGRQLIISNLDLNYMVATDMFARPDTRTIRPPTYTLSVSGMEFFRLFPRANDFRLSTAVRLNASFPYISPSAALPTNPVRHLVDAGYYDNYGTTVATRWLFQNTDWFEEIPLAERPPVVFLLRIRCFAFESEKRAFVTKAESDLLQAADPGESVRTAGGLFTLTAPLTGLFSAWRANMLYRGDERVAAIELRLAPIVRDFRYPPIECEVDPSLNWALTPDNLNRIHADVRTRLRGPAVLANYFNNRLPALPTDSVPPGAAAAAEFARMARAIGPGPTVGIVKQFSPQYKRAPVTVQQTIESQADLAARLGRFSMLDPAAIPPRPKGKP